MDEPRQQHPRDRVLDAVKATALAIVVAAHCLGWHGWDETAGDVVAVLVVRPDVWWITWLQALPLFFAAGAVANRDSWRRRPNRRRFWQRRALRLGTPALVFVVVGSATFLPLTTVLPAAEQVGRRLPFHLWFLAVYGLIVLAVPATSRWARRPLRTLAVWLAVIVAVDVLRVQVADAVGYVNVLLVWGWVHQVGYSLPALRDRPRLPVALAGVASLTSAAVVAGLGPYSHAMVSVGGDVEMSNMSPPTVVLALFALGQVLLLAALWPWLARVLRDERVWSVVRAVGARAVGIYLWHLPVLAVLVGVAVALGVQPEPFGPAWWAVHLGVLGLVLVASWLVADVAGMLDLRLQARVLGLARRRTPVLASAVLLALATLAVGLTGFGTWWGPALAGLSFSTLLGAAGVVTGWFGVGLADVESVRLESPREGQSRRSGVAADQPDLAALDGAHPPRRDAALSQEPQGRADLALG